MKGVPIFWGRWPDHWLIPANSFFLFCGCRFLCQEYDLEDDLDEMDAREQG